jgi:cytochrome c-type biogenesis protein
MDVGVSSIALTFGAGLASVASPCVLPVLPIILSGTAEDHRSRPALIVTGIATSFVLMGVVTSLFGSVVGPVLPALEKVFGAMVIAFGLLLLADVNLFKKFTWVNRIQAGGSGR